MRECSDNHSHTAEAQTDPSKKVKNFQALQSRSQWTLGLNGHLMMMLFFRQLEESRIMSDEHFTTVSTTVSTNKCEALQLWLALRQAGKQAESTATPSATSERHQAYGSVLYCSAHALKLHSLTGEA